MTEQRAFVLLPSLLFVLVFEISEDTVKIAGLRQRAAQNSVTVLLLISSTVYALHPSIFLLENWRGRVIL